MITWYAIATVLQSAHVVLAEFVPAVGLAAGILGVGIPLVIGVLWAKAERPERTGEAFGHGFLLGFGPALFGLILAVLLGQVEPFLLAVGSTSSGVAGALGALAGRALGARRGIEAA